MAGRYAPRKYDLSGLRESAPSDEDKRKEKDADLWRFIGDVAPGVGMGLGGVAGGLIGSLGGPAGIMGGAAAGAGIGQGLGQAVGAGAKGHAENQVAEREDRESYKMDRKAALLQALMASR